MGIQAFAAAEPKRAAAWGVWLLGAGETIIWACIYYVFAALLLPWEQSLGWAKTDLTLGLTVAILVAAVASPMVGRAIDAGHGRWALGGGAMLGAAALAALSQVETTLGFVAVWAVIGLAQGACLYEPCFSVVTRATGDKARPAITRITLLAGLASAIAFPSAAILLEVTDWRGVLMVFAVASAVVAAPLLFFGTALLEAAGGDAVKPAPRAENKAALRAALARPEFWLIALAFPLMAINHGILLNHIRPLMAERGIADVTAVLVASTVGPMQVVGRLVLMAIERHVRTIAMAAVAFGGTCIASLILMVAGASPALAFAFAAMQGGAYGLTSILKPALTAEILGRAGFGAIAGWLAFPQLACGAVAPYLGALIWGFGGYDLVIPITAAIAATGVACILLLRAVAGRRTPA